MSKRHLQRIANNISDLSEIELRVLLVAWLDPASITEQGFHLPRIQEMTGLFADTEIIPAIESLRKKNKSHLLFSQPGDDS